ncbi:MAG: hypothetical protein MRJ93_14925 [Nitrososphaeraceae archaeon]|nr:hypothetical protein [Nitrososphaeraceae archaeon]
MAGSNISLIQIISTLIGSTLTLFLLNNLASEINQPQINLNVITDDIDPALNNNFTNDNNDNNKNSITSTKFETFVKNNGESAATNLLLSLLYPNGNITDFGISFQSENINITKKTDRLLVAELKRLSTDSSVAITTIVECNANTSSSSINGHIYSDNQNLISSTCFQPTHYIATVSYDQGSTFLSNIDSSILYTYGFDIAHYKHHIWIFAITVAVISFMIALLYKRLNNFRKRLSKPKFVFDIVKEIITVKETLESDNFSKRIFPIEKWYSKDLYEKRKIFDDYEDYYYIEDFYSKLKNRDDIVSNRISASSHSSSSSSEKEEITKKPADKINNKENSNKTLDMNNNNDNNDNYNDNGNKNDKLNNNNQLYIKRLNDQCLFLANNAIKNISWSHYQDIGDRIYYLPLIISITIISGLVISYTFEYYRLLFFQFFNLESVNFQTIIDYILITILRSIVFFLLAKEIINFKTLFAYEIGVKNNILSFFVFDRRAQLKLFLLSFIIAGIPSFLLFLLYDINEIQYLPFDFSKEYTMRMTVSLVDTLRLAILALIIPKFIVRDKVKLTK